MKKKNRKQIFVLIFLAVLVLFFSNNVMAVNVGVSPATINFEEVLRGGYAERSVLISVDSTEEIEITATKWGDVADWINISESDFVTTRNSPYSLLVSVNPPEDVPNGNYTGFVRIMTAGLGEGVEGHAVGIVRSSLDLAVNIQIIDTEVVRCRASDFEVSSVEEGDDIIFKMSVENNGNIRLNPRVAIDIWDQDQTSIVETIDFSEVEILPTTEEEILIRVPSGSYDVSQYWADVSVVDCFAQKLMTFDVLEEGALKADGILLRILSKEKARVDENVPIEVTFKNVGQKEVRAQFIGKVSKGGNLVQNLESREISVLIGDIGEYNLFFTPTETGRYVIDGRVFYDSKKTFEKSFVVEVVREGGGAFPYLLILLYLVVIGIIGFLIFRIRKERKLYRRRLRRLR